MLFTYNIHTEPDNDVFRNICKKIENAANVKPVKTLIDVDGSLIWTYEKEGREIKVFNDYEVGAVYIDSDIDISDIVT